jgi:hypothetical protein
MNTENYNASSKAPPQNLTSLKVVRKCYQRGCWSFDGGRGREARAGCSKRSIQPSGRVVHWNTRRWDVCSDFLHRSSRISRCKIHRVDAGAVELKGGPHTTLRSWGPARLTPPPKKQPPVSITRPLCVCQGWPAWEMLLYTSQSFPLNTLMACKKIWIPWN